ncbi:hypothetical protein EON65_44280, partial [archaeon]
MMNLLHIYRCPGDSEKNVMRKVKSKLPSITSVRTEFCFNVEVTNPEGIPPDQKHTLLWLLAETFEPHKTRENDSFLAIPSPIDANSERNEVIVEVGPRLAVRTSWSSNCAAICSACHIDSVGRMERSRRYHITSNRPLSHADMQSFLALVHDRMTEVTYPHPLQSFG